MYSPVLCMLKYQELLLHNLLLDYYVVGVGAPTRNRSLTSGWL